MRLVAALLFVAAAGAVHAQPAVHTHAPGGICTLYDAGGVARPGPEIAPASVQARRGAASETVVSQGLAATFQVTYTGFTPEAQAAFQRAVDIWADHLTSSVPIRVEATFGDLGGCAQGLPCVLGSAGPRLVRDWGGTAPRAGTWYPFALADALAGRDLFPPDDDGASADIQAVFNSGFDRFYFQTGTPPTNLFDFTTIVLHELGHGLGFIGSGDVDDGVIDADDSNFQECDGIDGHGCKGIAGGDGVPYPLIFDRFIEAGDGTAFLNGVAYPNNSVVLGDLLQSEDLFVDAPTVRAVYGGERPPIWAPAAFEGGSSFSHWDEILITRGTSAALMTPAISPGEQYDDPGSITCAFFQDMGWPLGAGCSAIVASEPSALDRPRRPRTGRLRHRLRPRRAEPVRPPVRRPPRGGHAADGPGGSRGRPRPPRLDAVRRHGAGRRPAARGRGRRPRAGRLRAPGARRDGHVHGDADARGVRHVFLTAVLLGLAAAPAAQPESGGVRSVCRLPVSAQVPHGGAARRAARPAPCPASERTATFEVAYTDFPPDAEAAFQAAVDTWACRVRSGQPIRIDASWTRLGGATLGTAGPFLVRNFEGAPSRDVWYPAALADALAGRDLGDATADIEASFNSAFGSWHLALDTPPDGTYDLYTVVLHEIGHGLGLIGAMEVEEGRGIVGTDPEGPFVYDLLAEDAAGVALLDNQRYPDGSVALAEALQSEVHLAGPRLRRASVEPVPLYAPDRWVGGGSYSHLDEDAFAPGTPDGLMTPFIGRSETVEAPGAVVCAALGDLGWELAGECARLVGTPTPPAAGLAVERLGPNPVRTRTTLRLRSDVPRLVRVAVFDVLGRRVLDAGTTALVASRPSTVTVEARSLAAGVYFVVVEGAGALVTIPVTVAR